MNMSARLVISLVALLTALSLRAENDAAWKQLKLGMSAADAIAALGEPVQRSKGRGFETWTYDRGAEVLIFGDGAVVGWTIPSDLGNQPARSRDVWSERPKDGYLAALYAGLPAPVATVASAAVTASRNAPLVQIAPPAPAPVPAPRPTVPMRPGVKFLPYFGG